MYSSQDFEMIDQFQTPLPDELTPKEQECQKESNFDIILSKYLNNLQLTDIELQQLSEQERLVLDKVEEKTKGKKKRADEYQKLFFKKAFKFAQKKFFKVKKNKSRRMSQFYHFYFDKIAQTICVPLINFYHPDRKTRPGFKSVQKSFNTAYVRLLLRSQQFKQVSKEYHHHFISQCTEDRNFKIKTFTNSMKRVFERSKDKGNQILKYLNSSQCKIPWSNNDIIEASRRAFEELNEENDGANQSEILQTAKTPYESCSEDD